MLTLLCANLDGQAGDGMNQCIDGINVTCAPTPAHFQEGQHEKSSTFPYEGFSQPQKVSRT